MVKKDKLIALVISVVHLILSYSYFLYFSEAIINEKQSYHVFTRLLIPDTYIYYNIIY